MLLEGARAGDGMPASLTAASQPDDVVLLDFGPAKLAGSG
jgi:hypothetical protein